MTELQARVNSVIQQHGGLRAAARALGMCSGYLSRLQTGERANPRASALEKLGLKEVPDGEEKICWCCKRYLPVGEFNRDRAAFDGMCGRCKKCDALMSKARNAREPSEAQLQRRREWRKTRFNDPKKLAARHQLQTAVRNGRVTRWPVCAMPECDEKRVHAHHADYDNPLGVTWLCASHHALAHHSIRSRT